MDPVRLQGLVKPLLHAVLKKVHPDYFTHHPAAKAANHSAVQRLQGLLTPVLAPGTPTRDRDSAGGPLEFIVRGDGEALQTVAFEFSDWRPRGRAELQAQRAREMLALCSALGTAPGADAAKEIEDAIGQAAQSGPPAWDGAAAARLRAARAREAVQNYKRGQPAADPRAALMAAMRRVAWPPAPGSAKAARPRLDRSKVFFAAEVAPERYTGIAAHIEGLLPGLEYGSWCALPMMVVDRWQDALRRGATRYPGFVVVPSDVDANAFRRYLRENLDEIRGERCARNTRHGR
ncbi:hypothetical protein IWQ56_002887 [Coemansia nantahalensis]|nr:hypothetical protein IWQ56_002887 [Coemansia nantahalensis]